MNNTARLSAHQHQVVSSFNLASAGYDKQALRFLSLSANRLVELAEIHSGQKILDVATGTGSAAIAAAHIVGPAGQVVGVDLANDMLEKAQRNIKAAGLTNIEIRQGNAEHLNYNNHSFDAVICAAGIFFLTDMFAGLREWQRVTKNGGLVAFSSFSETAFNPLIELFEARIRSYDVSLPSPTPLQRLNDPEKCRDLLQNVGFENIEVRTEQLGYYLSKVDEWWDIVWNSGPRVSVSKLAPEKIEQFRAEHLAEVGALATDTGIWLDVPVIFAMSRKPLGN